MKVKVCHNNLIISSDIELASTMASRLIGLMFRKAPKNSEGLLLQPCNSIHTFFMRYSLDVVFLSKKNEVVKVIRNLRPWRMTLIYFKANKTLEMPAGKLPLEIKEGDFLEVTHV